MLTLGFKWCKSDAGIYYFIDKKTKELVIVIVYVNDDCFMDSKDLPLLLKLKQKFIMKYKYHNLREIKDFLGICINCNHKNQKIFVD